MPSLSDYCRSVPLLCGQQMAVFELWSPAENTREQSGLATPAWSQESVDWTGGHWERQPIEDLKTWGKFEGLSCQTAFSLKPKNTIVPSAISEVQIKVLLPSFLHSWTLLHPPAVLLPTKIIEVRRISSLWKSRANICLVSGSNRVSPSLLHSHMWLLCLWVKILQTVSLLKPSSSTRSIIERFAASPCLSKVPHYETHRTAYPTRTQNVLVSPYTLSEASIITSCGAGSVLQMSKNT